MHPTQNTESPITHSLDYAATTPNELVTFSAIDMVLHIEHDTSYLSKQRTCIQTGGKYYISSQNPTLQKIHTSHPHQMYQYIQNEEY